MKKAVVSGALSDCEWCGEVVAGCKPTHDKQEGPYGDLYNVCQECRDEEEDPLMLEDF